MDAAHVLAVRCTLPTVPRAEDLRNDSPCTTARSLAAALRRCRRGVGLWRRRCRLAAGTRRQARGGAGTRPRISDRRVPEPLSRPAPANAGHRQARAHGLAHRALRRAPRRGHARPRRLRPRRRVARSMPAWRSGPTRAYFATTFGRPRSQRMGSIAEGYARAARWIRPARDPDAAQRTKFKALAVGRRQHWARSRWPRRWR